LYQIIKVKVEAAHYLKGFVPDGVESSYVWSAYYLDDASYYQLITLVDMPGLSKFLPIIAFSIPFFALFRLAKFNIDPRQSEGFIGLPTPAATLFFVGISMLIVNSFNTTLFGEIPTAFLFNPYLLSTLSVIVGILMVSELPMFSLKFKSFGWSGNEIRYIFLTICVILLATLFLWGLPIIIVLYVILSIINNLLTKSAKDEI
jgi:CDP-diacylglycerol--serine O-phosphatidyltransferase